MTAAEQMIRYANTDDSLVGRVTVVDGVDLNTITEIVSDEKLDAWRADPNFSYASGERRCIVCRDADGRRHRFYFAAEGSPDGIWAHLGANPHDPAFLGRFGKGR